MAKTFFDVFSEIDRGGEMSAVLKDAEILKMTENSNHRRMRIFMRFHTVVPKSGIRVIEKMLEKRYFGGDSGIDVKVIERFDISDDYTPEQIFSIYRDSILDELFETDRILYQIVKDSDFSFSGSGGLSVAVPDDGTSVLYEDSLTDYLDKVFKERFGKDMPIVFSLKAPKKDLLSDRNARLSSQVADIIKTVEENRAKSADEKAEKPLDEAKSEKKKYQKNTDPSSGRTFVPEKKFDGARRAPTGRFRRSTDPDCIYGGDIDRDAEYTPISELSEASGRVTIRGKVITSPDLSKLRMGKSGKYVFIFSLFDGTDTISAKLFLSEDDYSIVSKEVKPGAFFRLEGECREDTFEHELMLASVRGVFKTKDFFEKRRDLSVEKRVELHCHTKMSDSDGVSDVSDIIKQAIAFGHKAIAITDHGVVQAFPDACSTLDKAKKKDAGLDFKVIYGMEAYLVDDTKALVENAKGQSLDGDFVVFDLETTGLNSKTCHIIEFGAVKVQNGKITDTFSRFVDPGMPIPYRITELTDIRDDDVRGQGSIEEVLADFLVFSKGCVLVAHNAEFDTSCIKYACERTGNTFDFTYADTMTMARLLLPGMTYFKLDQVAKKLGIRLDKHHRAINDAQCTAEIFIRLTGMLKDRGIEDLDALNEAGRLDENAIKKGRASHAIILAKNDIGRINLYRLVSMSHLNYFSKKPRIPKSVLNEYREGLILGSACEAGELFQNILLGRGREEIYRVASYYDYFEIQPVGNNAFYLRDDKYDINTVEDLQEINRQIVALGEEMKRPVVATCDVHFLNPEDEVFRRIIMCEKGFPDADQQPPLYLHTTEEMLDEFSYLGSDKAYEVVIKNPNMIADMIEVIRPTRPDKCPPVIPDSDKLLRNICYTKAHEMYGEELPEIVSARLERELTSIIGNGYAVMYIIAQKLVWKSVEDGYLVGSRGSVGSSFVATMAGITEVNPLPPHYLCPKCHYSDFDSETVKQYSDKSGCDLPDMECPVCGEKLGKIGFDIPFETFLGFKGDKEPDIDLNFSGDYQNKAHKYTEVIFGEGQTFKAGTIGTLAEKTAYGYMMHYCEEHGLTKRRCEMERLAKGCEGVRRTTGQHPGGIIVLPTGEDINTFTPIQHPADKADSDIVTTHFDYHKIDENLLKLDILGHDDPTMIRMLEDLTGLDATKIPLDDKKVMTLFKDTSALGVPDGALWHCDKGTFGIPEFGTDNAMKMLSEAKPKDFSDLIRISGLSHGTNVWAGNAEDLLMSGTADISTCICTRDDIMTFLISKGLDDGESFKIMEAVRKGKVAKGAFDDWPKCKQDMIEHGIPDWYIGSCEKIEYMFPKAHAAAYVMMAWRIAWFKIYRPIAYYAAYFSIRAEFSYELMCRGKESLEDSLRDYDRRQKAREKITKKEEDLYADMRIVHEFYCRGFSFGPLDLYQSDATRFKIDGDKLIPPFSSVEGMGENQSLLLAAAAAERPFVSKNDLRQRGHAPQKFIDLMDKFHLLDGLPESDQISLFDVV